MQNNNSNINILNFSSIIKSFDRQQVNYLTMLYNTKNLTMLYRTKTIPEIVNRIKEKYKCRECAERISEYLSLKDASGNSIFPPPNWTLSTPSDSDSEEDIQFYKDIKDVHDKEPSRKITGVYVTTGDTVCNFERVKGHFEHYTKCITKKTDPSISPAEITKINFVIARYLYCSATESTESTNHMFNMLTKICTPTVKDGMDSLCLMKTCLANSVYGNILSCAVNWLHDLTNEIYKTGKEWIELKEIEKFNICVVSLLGLPISKDLNGFVILPYQTASNNVVDLLGSATTVEGMIKMIETRMSPLNYQRRDPNKELSNTQIENAIKYLGDFTNTIMTVDELNTFEPNSILTPGSPDPKPEQESVTLTAFEKMKSINPKINTNLAGGFANRANRANRAGNPEPVVVNTIKDVLVLCRKYPNTEIEICVYNMNFTYVAKTTLDETKRSVPYFWCFSGHKSYDRDCYKKVVALVPTFENTSLKQRYLSVHFILENQKPFSTKNCCFPEFLSSEYSRTCGPAFEKLNNTVNIIVPDNQIACGVGTNASNANYKLITPVFLKINGIKFEINLLQ
jgi:hypothetical protein